MHAKAMHSAFSAVNARRRGPVSVPLYSPGTTSLFRLVVAILPLRRLSFRRASARSLRRSRRPTDGVTIGKTSDTHVEKVAFVEIVTVINVTRISRNLPFLREMTIKRTKRHATF